MGEMKAYTNFKRFFFLYSFSSFNSYAVKESNYWMIKLKIKPIHEYYTDHKRLYGLRFTTIWHLIGV